jgi:hypothetical protein
MDASARRLRSKSQHQYRESLTSKGESTGQPLDYDSLPGLPPLTVEILATDVTTHLDGVERQGGGIGSAGFDEKQQEIRAFFSGAHAAD